MADNPTPNSPAFTPVALRSRHDGWTPRRQIAFIEALAETGCIEEACRHVGMSRQGAYALRRHPEGGLFRDAWDAAVDYAMHRLEQAAIGRAVHGVPRPIFYKGEQVGEAREHDERLTMFLLRYRRASRFGGWLDGQIPDDGEDPDPYPDPSGTRLERCLREISDHDEDWPPDRIGSNAEALSIDDAVNDPLDVALENPASRDSPTR